MTIPTSRQPIWIIAIAAIGATLGLTTAAQATTYYACVSKKNGVMRLVPHAKKCKRNERRISFDSQGPSGRNGAPGKNGAPGRNGANGKNGQNGLNGANGVSGFTTTLPKGATEEGTWAVAVNPTDSTSFSAISFDIPLAAAPVANLVGIGQSTTACPGTAAAPAAASGNLCVYVSTAETISIQIFDPAPPNGEVAQASPQGTTVRAYRNENSPGLAYGTWAVTG